MAITRITKGVIEPNESYDTHNIVSTGIITSVGADINGDLDVDGHTNLDNVSISGVTTFAGSVNNLVLSGVVTTTGLDVNGNADISGNMSVGGVLTYEDVTSIDSVGIITARNDIHVGAGVSAVGVGTFGSLDIGGDIDVDGHTNLDNVSISGVTTTTDDIIIGADNKKLKLGAGEELQLYQAGNHSIIQHNGGHYLLLRSNSFGIMDAAGTKNMFTGFPDTHTSMYYNGSYKIRTQNTGAEIVGTVVATGADINGDIDVDGHTNLDNVSIAGVSTFSDDIKIIDNKKIFFGTGGDLEISHNPSSIVGEIQNHSGPLLIQNSTQTSGIYIRAIEGRNSISINANASVDLYYNNSKKLETTNSGISVTGNIIGTGNLNVAGNIEVDDYDSIFIGTGNDIRLFHNGSASFIRSNGTGIPIQIDNHTGAKNALFNPGGSTELYFNNSKKLETSSDGVTIHNSNLLIQDSKRLKVGTDADLALFFNGTTSFIRSQTSSTLKIDHGNTGETMGVFIPNDAVELYFNGSKKFETDSSGVAISGGITDAEYVNLYSTSPSISFIDTNSNPDFMLQNANGLFKLYDSTNGVDRWTVNSDGTFDVNGNLDANAGLDVTGNITGTGDLTLTDTTADSAAGPELKLFRNSASPADADYLGQIKFAGESDTGVERNYAKITGKILDASNGTEDGIIEFAHIKGGSQNISARFRSDSLQLLNGTALTVAGSTTVTGNIIPSSDSATDIGTNSVRFANAYVDTYYGDGSNLTGISVGGSSGIDFNDNVQVRFGTGNDAQLLHTGGQFRILNDTGDFYIKGAAAGNGDMFIEAKSGVTNARFFANSGATFYFGGNERIRVDTLGINVGTSHLAIGATVETNGQATFTGIVTASSFKLSDGSAVGGVESDAQYNTVAGTNAGNSFSGTSATNNTLFGYEAGTAITSADGNTAVGYQALKTATTGGYSTAVGRGALEKNNGTDNTAVGFFASNENTSGTNNNSFGQQSGRNTTSGSWNCSFGNLTLNTNQTGNYNTCFGGFALRNSTSDNNTAIGYNAGVNITSGQSNTCVGSRAGQSIQTTSSNTCVGDRAGFTAQGEQNTYVGKNSGYNGGGSQNVGIGYLALRAHSSGGAGSYNVAIGYESGYTLSGSNNTLVGQQSGYDLTSGSYNTGIGNAVLYELTTGNYNSVLGRFAGRRITTGHNNTCIGDEAGDNITTGSNNLLLGHDATASSVTVSNEVTIGDANITKFRIPGINVTLKDNGGTPTQGHVLTVDGNGEAGFAAASGTTINNNANNRVITGSGTANTLEGESNLTFDGSTLTVTASGGSTAAVTATRFNGNLVGPVSATTITASQGVTLDSYLEVGSSLTIADTIAHLGDTNTKIRFPTADTITFETDGSERLRINSTGQLLLMSNTGYNPSSSLLSLATDASAAANMLSDSSSIYNHNNPAFVHVQNMYNTGDGQEAGIILHSKSSFGGAWAIYGKRTTSSFKSDLIFRGRSGSSNSAERLRIDLNGQVLPGADDAQNLGSSTKRWANIYAADMHFSNKGKTNDVDGTWGDWTLQEGEDSVYMINNRTGKKYAITMKEVN